MIGKQTIGEKIREIRLRNEWTLTELAKRIGCAPTTIAGWETNEKRGPGKYYLAKTAQALGVSLDYLLDIEISHPKVPCYGSFPSFEFSWVDTKVERYIEIMLTHLKHKRNSYGIM